MNDSDSAQSQFLSLLLKHHDLVADYKDSFLDSSFFDQEYKILAHAIMNASDNGVLLTRRSFIDFVSRIKSSKKEISEQETTFTKILYTDANRNDYPLLKAKIYENYLTRVSANAIREFVKHKEEHGILYAVKHHASFMNDIASSGLESKKIDYDDVNNFSDEYLKWIDDYRNDRIEKEFVSTGFEEIDKTSSVGVAPGTLTIFAADVGGFKCGWHGNIHNTQNGERITLKEIHKRVQEGSPVFLQQYEEKTGKLVYRKVIDSVDSGVKQCYKLTTALGHEIISTGDHRHRFIDGYRPVSEVLPGDKIAVVRKLPMGRRKVDRSEAVSLGENIYKISNSDINNHEYRIDAKVFEWDEESLSIMLSIMFGLGAEIYINNNDCKLIYKFNHENLAKDIRDMLLKFGIMSSVYKKESWFVEISEISQVIKFIRSIGFAGGNQDKNIHHIISIENNIDKYSESDIYWDEVVSVVPVGLQQTYDLAMPDDNNFVSNNIVTHNSTIMLNIAFNAWNNGKNVLFVPLEMPRIFIEHKLVSMETKIPFDAISDPKLLTKEQLDKVIDCRKNIWKNKKGRFFIMDSYEDRTRVSLIRKQISNHVDIFKPDVLVVDYIANLESDKERARQDIEIGDMLKELLHMGRKGVIHDSGFGVISAAQVGREALRRVRKQPSDRMSFNSEDLRGAHDYSADASAIYVLFPDPQQPTEKLQLFCVKSRYGKKIFPDGSNKAILNVRPEISIIESSSDYFNDEDAGDILQKLVDDDEESSNEDNSTFDDFSKNISEKPRDGFDLWDKKNHNSDSTDVDDFFSDLQ